MDSEFLLKKLQEFKKLLSIFVKSNKNDIEEVHKLRVRSRELFSLLSVDDIFYNKLKKVIKLSNKIRDIDVFFEVYLDSLPKKYITKLDIKSLTYTANKSRKKKLYKLHLYLESLEVPTTIEFQYEESTLNKIDENELTSPNQVELHKYRIFIKKRLYKEKTSSLVDENKIKILTIIKDILGTINDNINGLNILKSYDIDPDLIKEIQDFTQKENLKLFKEFKNFVNTKKYNSLFGLGER